MRRIQRVPGTRYGRLILKSQVSFDKHPRWLCQCDCGKIKEIDFGAMQRGLTKSCGCYAKGVTIARSTVHGFASRSNKLREHTIWSAMKRRCYNKNDGNYCRYGKLGIRVCHKWKRSFAAFLEDMGRCPAGLTLERLDSRKSYNPTNCIWADRITQANNCRSNHHLRFEGKRLTIAQWGRETGISHKKIEQRINKLGWSAKRALSER